MEMNGEVMLSNWVGLVALVKKMQTQVQTDVIQDVEEESKKFLL